MEVPYNPHAFPRRVEEALRTLTRILHSTRHPKYAANVQHEYDDKYGLTEFVTNAAIAAQLNCLEALGMTDETLRRCAEWCGKGLALTLRLEAERRCVYLREVTREVPSKTRHVSESTLFGKSESKSVTRVTEHFWKLEHQYSVVIFQGASPSSESKVVLQQRTGSCEIMTTTKETPHPTSLTRSPVDANVSWLFKQIASPSLQVGFGINRSKESCKTPRRNEQVDAALTYARDLHKWTEEVPKYFEREVFPVLKPTSESGEDGGKGHGLDLASLRRADIFVPVLPILEEGAPHEPTQEQSECLVAIGAAANAGEKQTPVLGIGDIHNMLSLQRHTMGERVSALHKGFADGGVALISVVEAKLCVLCRHLTEVLEHHKSSLDCIEAMLRQQLIAAVGRELTAADFATFMVHHNKKLFRAAHAPQPFSFAVRRPDHYPEGTVSIEAQLSGGSTVPAEPICTLVRSAYDAPPMSFRLNAATRVHFTGERHLHGFIAHEFAGRTGASLSLTARARQFSCFMLLLGKIGVGHTFEPKHAIILQNKDDLRIPLLLEQLPTAKEFRDAIASLSPEQQRFAKAYRAMQLEGSLFAVLVVQLKPQLERLLKLPADSLTKEIALTQQLLTLFIEHQIPSDLLSYGGDEEATTGAKLAEVKQHVGAIVALIDEAKKAEVEEAKQRHLYLHPAKAAHEEEEMEDACDDAGAFQAPVMEGRVYSRGMRLQRRRCECASACCDSMPQAMAFGSAPPPMAMMAAAAPMKKKCGGGGAPPPPLPRPQAMPNSGGVSSSTRAPGSSTGSAVETSSTQRHPSANDPESDFDHADDALAVDYTKLPATLDSKLAEFDVDGALRPTKINVGEVWTRRAQKALLAAPSESTLDEAAQRTEKDKAFDLLDALSRSGVLPLEAASLHIVLACTHCFDSSLIDTVVVKNVNPIEKLERSSLLMATTIQDAPAAQLIRDEQQQRVATYSAPALLPPA